MMWKCEKLRYLYAQFYLSLLCYPFNIVKDHTVYTRIIYLNNCLIQILKKKKNAKVSSFPVFLLQKIIIRREVCSNFLPFFPEYVKICDNCF